MREKRPKTQVKRKIKTKTTIQYPPLVPPPTTCDKSTTPHLSHPPIICNNNTMEIEFLAQMSRSDKCGSVRNDEFNLHIRSGVGP